MRSTLLTSRVPAEQWHERMKNPPLANAILGRLIHNAYQSDLEGELTRKKKRIDLPHGKEVALSERRRGAKTGDQRTPESVCKPDRDECPTNFRMGVQRHQDTHDTC
ncbi:MAG: ATP-binding protein [Deltaproteobacteria bacterium]|nr:ATP-binding protein [Deltaproteobacteria bacterium]